jgi:threonine aldolase
MKRGFGSDNHSGVCPEVLEAIARVNKDHAVAYGDDEYCADTEQRFREQFGEQARVFFAFNGTGCNTLCIDPTSTWTNAVRRSASWAAVC